MQKLQLTIIAFAALTSVLSAQVKYKLTRMTDNATYMVSMVPDATWMFPQNVTTTAQVSLRLPSNSHFIAGHITSLVPETRWIDNSYLERPVGDANANYILFGLQNIGTQAFSYEAGKELPLFTFQNIGTTCFGSIELTDNSKPETNAVVAGGYNVGQHIATLGAQGEAFTGNVEGSRVVCQGTSTGTSDLEGPLSISKGFPIPASTELTIEYQINNAKLENLKLEVTNVLGETITTQDVKATNGVQQAKFDVSTWAEGVYFFRLTSKKGVSKAKSFSIIK
jgi:hypothetical protein